MRRAPIRVRWTVQGPACGSALRTLCAHRQLEQLTRLGGRCRMPVVLSAEGRNTGDQLGVGGREPTLAVKDVVLQPGADMAAARQRPAVGLQLIPAGRHGRPRRLRHELPDLRGEEVNQRLPRRQSVPDTHDQLYLRWGCHQPALKQFGRLVQHGQVEHLDLRLDTEIDQPLCDVLDNVRRVFVDAVREVQRPGRERRHLGTPLGPSSNGGGSDAGRSWAAGTWTWQALAPASNASIADATWRSGTTGTAG